MRIFIGSGQYRQIAPLVNAEPGALVIPSPHDSERVNLTALSRQVSGKAIPIKNKMMSTIKLQSFVIDRDGAESVRRFFRGKIKELEHGRAHHPLVTNQRLDDVRIGVARA